MTLDELALHADDAQRVQVFADQLSERGDPRGEFIALQLELEARPTDASLREREATVLRANRARWLGELAGLVGVDGRSLAPLAVTWRRGFFDSVRVGPPVRSYQTAEIDFPQTIARLFALESARLLRELIVGAMASRGSPVSWGACVGALAAADVPTTLRRLEFNRGGYWDISTTQLGDLSPAYPRLQHLQELRIELGQLELGEPDLPRVRTLELITGSLSGANVESVCRGHLPELERLTLYLGETGGDHGCLIDFEDLAPVFEADGLKRVVHLALANSNLADEIAEAIGSSRILRQLKTLDLSNGTMTDVGARRLLARRAAFAHLERLDVTRNFLSHDVCRELTTLAREVIVVDQQDPGAEDRYVAISE